VTHEQADLRTTGAGIDATALAAALAPEIAALIADKLRGIVALGDDAILGEEAAAAALDKSRSTLEAWRSRGLGPRWIKLGPRAVGYRVGDVRRFVNEQVRR
jgi:predicted DNA-binding transcriptional regulator AlpA